MLLLWSSWLPDDLLFIIFLFLCFEASGWNAELAPSSCPGWSSSIWAVLPTPAFYLEIICVDCVRPEVPTVLSQIVVAAMLPALNLLTHLTWKPAHLLPPETPRTAHQPHVICQRKDLPTHLPARSSSAFSATCLILASYLHTPSEPPLTSNATKTSGSLSLFSSSSWVPVNLLSPV